MAILRSRPLTAMVIDSEPVARSAHAAHLRAAGFEVLDEVDNAARALHALPHVRPSLVLSAQELLGMSATETIPAIMELEDPPEVIIVTTDLALRETAMKIGAFAIIDKSDLALLDEVLADARHLFETGERRSSGEERRAKADRRRRQDWSKVTSERRQGEDRRHTERRDA